MSRTPTTMCILEVFPEVEQGTSLYSNSKGQDFLYLCDLCTAASKSKVCVFPWNTCQVAFQYALKFLLFASLYPHRHSEVIRKQNNWSSPTTQSDKLYSWKYFTLESSISCAMKSAILDISYSNLQHSPHSLVSKKSGKAGKFKLRLFSTQLLFIIVFLTRQED